MNQIQESKISKLAYIRDLVMYVLYAYFREENTHFRYFIHHYSASLDHFGQLVNGGLDFEVLQNGTILQGSLTLVCRGDGTSETQWIYSQNLDLSNNQEINATFNIQTGLSWLKVDDSKQGVYKCQINDTTSYMVGLYRQISE